MYCKLAILASFIISSSAEAKIQWNLASSFPPGTVLHATAQVAADMVSTLTDGKFKLNVVSGAGTKAALKVKDGLYEACHTSGNYLVDEDPAFSAGASLPFTLTARGFNAWHYAGGGIDAYNKFLATQGLIGFPGGNTGVQMAGWFKRQVNKPEDLQGLKMRIGGLGAKVAEKLGVTVVSVPAGEIYDCLKNGTIDAAEFVGPADDLNLKLNEVASYYYHPGWLEPSATMHFMINKASWEKLPDAYKNVLRLAFRAADADMLQRYDYYNPTALVAIKASGITPIAYPTKVLDAYFSTTADLYSEFSAKNEEFKRLFTSVQDFNRLHLSWKAISDFSYDEYLLQRE